MLKVILEYKHIRYIIIMAIGLHNHGLSLARVVMAREESS